MSTYSLEDYKKSRWLKIIHDKFVCKYNYLKVVNIELSDYHDETPEDFDFEANGLVKVDFYNLTLIAPDGIETIWPSINLYELNEIAIPINKLP